MGNLWFLHDIPSPLTLFSPKNTPLYHIFRNTQKSMQNSSFTAFYISIFSQAFECARIITGCAIFSSFTRYFWHPRVFCAPILELSFAHIFPLFYLPLLETFLLRTMAIAPGVSTRIYTWHKLTVDLVLCVCFVWPRAIVNYLQFKNLCFSKTVMSAAPYVKKCCTVFFRRRRTQIRVLSSLCASQIYSIDLTYG